MPPPPPPLPPPPGKYAASAEYAIVEVFISNQRYKHE
jgi:hypothetical protein